MSAHSSHSSSGCHDVATIMYGAIPLALGRYDNDRVSIVNGRNVDDGDAMVMTSPFRLALDTYLQDPGLPRGTDVHT